MMALDKHLFLDDLLGVNGFIAQADAMKEIENFLDHDFMTERELELEENYEELCTDFADLEEENGKLFQKIEKLEKVNRMLRTENHEVGNLLDEVIVGGSEVHFSYQNM